MDNNDAECHQPSKRKRSLSCTIQDTAKVKVQTEDGCLAADVSHHDNAKDVNYPNNILYEKELDTENVNVSNNRFGHGESFEAWHECNETINEERGEPIHGPISICSAENFDKELIVKHGSLSSLRYKETPFNVASRSNDRASGSGSSSEVKGSSLDFRNVTAPSSNMNLETQNRNHQELSLNFIHYKTLLSEADSSLSCQYGKGMSSSDNSNNILFSINKLPPNILVQIFIHLSLVELLKNVCLVCRTWYQLSLDPELWRRIDLRRQERVTDSALVTLTSYSDRVTYLDLTDTKELSCEGTMKVLRKCKHLQTLKLSRFFSLTDEVLEVIGESCRKLKCLLLEICYRISNKGIQKVAEGCPDLVELQLTQCIKVNNDGVMVLAEKCHQLKRLMVDLCGWITDNSIIELTVGCPLLEHLILTRCNLTDKSIQEIKKLQNLKVLDISCFPSTPAAISQVMKNCTLLECINLSLNSFVDDECIEMVAKYGSNLKRLYCVSCSITDQGLEMIGKYSKTIQHLDVRWCENLIVEGVRTVSLTCPSLRYIYLGFRNCDRVKIKAIRELDELYPNIVYKLCRESENRVLDLTGF